MSRKYTYHIFFAFLAVGRRYCYIIIRARILMNIIDRRCLENVSYTRFYIIDFYFTFFFRFRSFIRVLGHFSLFFLPIECDENLNENKSRVHSIVIFPNYIGDFYQTLRGDLKCQPPSSKCIPYKLNIGSTYIKTDIELFYQ
jgi:hypothetical protein